MKRTNTRARVLAPANPRGLALAHRGFTLVELLVVMGIILILVSLAVPAVIVARNKARNTEVKAGCNSIQAALEQFAVDHGGHYPGAHWEQDSSGNFEVGPGVIGALPHYDGAIPLKDFYVPKVASDARGPIGIAPYTPDGTPNPQALDALVVQGYLTDYPANPFLRATGSGKAQMSNLFLFNPILGDTTPLVANRDTLDWNRYTEAESMRQVYPDFGRGHFTYIPLNPVNNTGYDYVGEWTSGNLSDAQLSGYYKRCRGYILAGWGHSRLEDTHAKGISEKYWINDLIAPGTGGFDFDRSLSADPLEQILSDASAAGLVWDEMVDSAGSAGAFGGPTFGPGGTTIPNIDSSFYGAVFFKAAGSN